jgi:hypothetical protein
MGGGEMANIPKTEKKLREAKLFLSRMMKAAKAVRLDREDFDFYLSAFFNTGRSVTFCLHFEQKQAYDRWFPEWKEALNEDDRTLLKFMNDQRRAVTHIGGASVETVIEDVPMIEIEMDRGHPAYGDAAVRQGNAFSG